MFSTLQEETSAAVEPCLPAVPWVASQPSSTTTSSHTGEPVLCSTCITTCSHLLHGPSSSSSPTPPPLLKSCSGLGLSLSYASQDEDRVVEEVVAAGGRGDGPALAASFLLCLCVQHSSTCLQTSQLRRLLLKVAAAVQSAMWVSQTIDLDPAGPPSGQAESPVSEVYLVSFWSSVFFVMLESL